jgi:hypothetical protein
MKNEGEEKLFLAFDFNHQFMADSFAWYRATRRVVAELVLVFIGGLL